MKPTCNRTFCARNTVERGMWVRQSKRQRFLAEDVFAGSGCAMNGVGVKFVWGGNHYRVAIFAFQHSFEAAEGMLNFEF